MKTKTPNVDSAAVTARAVSRRLRKAGLLMSVRDRHQASEGLYVHRIGVSSTVSIGYHHTSASYPRKSEIDARARHNIAEARRILAEAGYVLDNNSHIKCKRAD